MTQAKERRCHNCGTTRRTTNKERPYVCEPECLRKQGRHWILNGQKKMRDAYDRGLRAGKEHLRRSFWKGVFCGSAFILVVYCVYKILG